MDQIAKAFSTGGIWMYVILGTSVIGLGIIVERFIFLFFKFNINATAFMAQIQKLVMANKIDHAIKLQRGTFCCARESDQGGSDESQQR